MMRVDVVWIGAVMMVALAGCAPDIEAPDPRNQQPFGFLEEPIDGTRSSGTVPFRGWALDDEGVAEIRAFVDGMYVASFTIALDRPDVAAAHPDFTKASSRAGWQGVLYLPPSVQNGERVLLAQAVDVKGLTRDLGSTMIVLER
jgi:hypothetical protein